MQRNQTSDYIPQAAFLTKSDCFQRTSEASRESQIISVKERMYGNVRSFLGSSRKYY